MKSILKNMYHAMHKQLGQQHWWPGDTPVEVAIGAILTQNTNWNNVEKAIDVLKQHELLDINKINNIKEDKLAQFIRPTGYYNVKAKRLKNFTAYLVDKYKAVIENMQTEDTEKLRTELLSIKGIGQETADSILLYALNRPVFVIDSYTKRILSRHNILSLKHSYEEFQTLFHESVKKDVKTYNEYHALLVNIGKNFCKTNSPKCNNNVACPLSSFQITLKE